MLGTWRLVHIENIDIFSINILYSLYIHIYIYMCAENKNRYINEYVNTQYHIEIKNNMFMLMEHE